jgi:hypothetical protein
MKAALEMNAAFNQNVSNETFQEKNKNNNYFKNGTQIIIIFPKKNK